MIRRFATWLCLLPAIIATAQGAAAAESAWAKSEFAQARLTSTTNAVGNEETLTFGLEIQLAPDWKTYWRSPGDAGLPVSLDWEDSHNIAEVTMLWPAPLRFTLFGLDTFGYEKEVVFPLVARLERPGEPAMLRANVSYQVCEEICIPLQAELSLTLPAGPAEPSTSAFLIEQYRARVPGDGSAAGLQLEGSRLEGSVSASQLVVTARSLVPFAQPDLIVEGPPGYRFGRPEVALTEEGLVAQLTLPVVLGAQVATPLERAPLTLTLIEGRRALEATLVPEGTLGPAAEGQAVPLALSPSDLGTMLTLLGLALLGGLILNLMPCVLPVLSLKLLSVIGQGGLARRQVRLNFLASAAGILASFLVLAGILAGLKAGGLSLGWGVQFQSPLFLAVMAVLVTLFAGNLFGLFEIALPKAVTGLEGTQRKGLTGHFLTGVLAMLLATPCSAPFLGTAVGFALARGPSEILAIFLALGLGLALPYLLVAAFPGVAQRLPRPGRWMVVLRRVLGLALIATAVWLLSVMDVAAGLAPTLAVGGLLLLVLLALWLGRHRGRGGLAAAGLVALLAILTPVAFPGEPAARMPDAGYVAFDAAAIPGLVAEGRTVFVDVTADWCITCKANKTLVLEKPSVQAALADEGVVAMRADWTRPDPAIDRFLKRFGRFGIPFNVVFGPRAPQGITLPELLSEGAVLDALSTAARP